MLSDRRVECVTEAVVEMTPILAIDLGASPAFAVVMGTDQAPVLLETRSSRG